MDRQVPRKVLGGFEREAFGVLEHSPLLPHQCIERASAAEMVAVYELLGSGLEVSVNPADARRAARAEDPPVEILVFNLFSYRVDPAKVSELGAPLCGR